MTRPNGVSGKKGEATLALFLQTHAPHQDRPRGDGPERLGTRLWTLRCEPCGDFWVSKQGPEVVAAERTGDVFGIVG